MTDRVHSLTVVLDEDMRTDDVQRIKDAILMIKGTITVADNIVDSTTYMAEQRARHEMRTKVWELLK